MGNSIPVTSTLPDPNKTKMVYVTNCGIFL